ncbi:hypothetical protein GXM_06068 [Nostoc sphaeroides CCNUC1]|uniref:Uncharacterized protein n=1 Tax=Nostoc sphaeroides CCNUC1 TaxID=2653204 RepID=A0A5P8W7D9_9NOSO|nr:hypothetical protein GXM_06068 [Nostoc sphaeroides CCNUC1]
MRLTAHLSYCYLKSNLNDSYKTMRSLLSIPITDLRDFQVKKYSIAIVHC